MELKTPGEGGVKLSASRVLYGDVPERVCSTGFVRRWFPMVAAGHTHLTYKHHHKHNHKFAPNVCNASTETWRTVSVTF